MRLAPFPLIRLCRDRPQRDAICYLSNVIPHHDLRREEGRGRDVLNEESGERETRKGRGGKRGKKRKTTSKRQRSRDKPRDIYLTLKKSLAASNFPSHSADKHSPLLFFLLQLYRHTYLANYKIVNLDTL